MRFFAPLQHSLHKSSRETHVVEKPELGVRKPQVTSGVGGGGTGGASAKPKVLIWWKSGQTPWKPGKICENLRKISETLGKLSQNTYKNGAQRALIRKKRCPESHDDLFSPNFFLASLENFGQKFFTPPKFACSYTDSGGGDPPKGVSGENEETFFITAQPRKLLRVTTEFTRINSRVSHSWKWTTPFQTFDGCIHYDSLG